MNTPASTTHSSRTLQSLSRGSTLPAIQALVYRSRLSSISLQRCRIPEMSSSQVLIFFSEDNFWQQALNHRGQDIKLMVKRTFITNDLGVHSLPKWASWLKAVVDGLYAHASLSFSDSAPIPQLRIYLSTSLEKPCKTTASSSN